MNNRRKEKRVKREQTWVFDLTEVSVNNEMSIVSDSRPSLIMSTRESKQEEIKEDSVVCMP
jgi:hypothetical protein